MFCKIDCKSVFKILSLSSEMQFSTDLALMNTQPTYWSWWRNTNDNGGISSCRDSCKEKLLNQSVWLTCLKRCTRPCNLDYATFIFLANLLSPSQANLPLSSKLKFYDLPSHIWLFYKIFIPFPFWRGKVAFKVYKVW